MAHKLSAPCFERLLRLHVAVKVPWWRLWRLALKGWARGGLWYKK